MRAPAAISTRLSVAALMGQPQPHLRRLGSPSPKRCRLQLCACTQPAARASQRCARVVSCCLVASNSPACDHRHQAASPAGRTRLARCCQSIAAHRWCELYQQRQSSRSSNARGERTRERLTVPSTSPMCLCGSPGGSSPVEWRVSILLGHVRQHRHAATDAIVMCKSNRSSRNFAFRFE